MLKQTMKLLVVGFMLLFLTGFMSGVSATDIRGTVSEVIQTDSGDTRIIPVKGRVFLTDIPHYVEPERSGPVELEEYDEHFEPRQLSARVGKVIEISAIGNKPHHIHLRRIRLNNRITRNHVLEQAFGQRERVRHIFEEPGLYEARCELHSNMTSYIRVLRGYFLEARTDEEGVYRMRLPENLPAGTYQLIVWVPGEEYDLYREFEYKKGRAPERLNFVFEQTPVKTHE